MLQKEYLTWELRACVRSSPLLSDFQISGMITKSHVTNRILLSEYFSGMNHLQFLLCQYLIEMVKL